jgi:hypothetical protein
MPSSKRTFENITDVTIPQSAKVIRDEYTNMGPGYAKVLELTLNLKDKNDLLYSIYKSHYFKLMDSIPNPRNVMPLIQHGKYKGLWYKQKDGFAFFGRTLNDRDVFTATFDSIENKASFGTFADD